jgi:ATP-dependent DNA helicase Q1
MLISSSAAVPYGTVTFSSPLYRKNLRYKVVPKPSHSRQVVSDMVKYILESHLNDTGIVYCLSRAVSTSLKSERLLLVIFPIGFRAGRSRVG